MDEFSVCKVVGRGRTLRLACFGSPSASGIFRHVRPSSHQHVRQAVEPPVLLPDGRSYVYISTTANFAPLLCKTLVHRAPAARSAYHVTSARWII